MSEEQKIDIILPEALVDIKVSTGFYQKMNALLSFYTEGKSPEEMKNAYTQIKSQKITEPWIDHLQTIFIFLKEFQKAANDAGFVKSMTKEEAETYVKEKYPEENKKIVDSDSSEDIDPTNQ